MTRLVVYAGTHTTGWADVYRRFSDWAGVLADSRVLVAGASLAGGGTVTWRRFVDSEDDGTLLTACREAVRRGADILLTGSEELEDPLRDAAHVAQLEQLARDAGMELSVVMTVRDQIGYLDALYAERVLQLATPKDFESFVSDPQPAARFDYAQAFAALIGGPDTTFVAVPYRSDAGQQALDVLRAVGVGDSTLDGLDASPTDPDQAAPIGPYTLAALRVLAKRFRRNGLMQRLAHRRLVAAGRQLADEASLAGWDQQPFWGWSPTARTAAIARYQPGNDAFAHEVWGRPWGDDWSDGAQTAVDLASSDPALVVALLTAVDETLQELRDSLARHDTPTPGGDSDGSDSGDDDDDDDDDSDDDDSDQRG
jgi:hypothetical protein